MSSTNYDVEFNLSYDNEHRHYIPRYRISVPYWYWNYSNYGPSEWWMVARYEAFISFDEESEEDASYVCSANNYGGDVPNIYPPDIWWSDSSQAHGHRAEIKASGIFTKAYFRNPYREAVTFTNSNCRVQPIYDIKALFEIQWNSTGFAANNDAWFKCSTVQKNTYQQYEWVSATVYYKKTTDVSYTSVAGTVSGSWSDVRIDTTIDFENGYTYDVYITAVADDDSTATTPVAQFTTTDAAAVATCISPVGAFLQGDVTFVWSHATEYGTPQYAFDLQYTNNNGSTWTTVSSHEVTTNTTKSATITDAGTYKWRVRTYNSNDVAGEWAEASFINTVPANPPTNVAVNTKGRPTVTWASVSQSAYQVQFLLSGSVVYDSGAVYTAQTSHFVNQYFNDERSYVVRVRIYNALGDVSEWVETGYQQTSVTDVVFTVTAAENGGAIITVTPDEEFIKYYLLRNNKLIAQITNNEYTDLYAVGIANYSVVGVTSADQSDIQTTGFKITYPHATIVTLGGQQITVNKRVDMAYQVQTSNEADNNRANFIGDGLPTHYPSDMRLKSFSITCFDDQDYCESLIGNVVFYADNFGNGGYCMVKSYSKTDNFIQNSRGVYANEVQLILEVTNYDDSIKYPI